MGKSHSRASSEVYHAAQQSTRGVVLGRHLSDLQILKKDGDSIPRQRFISTNKEKQVINSPTEKLKDADSVTAKSFKPDHLPVMTNELTEVNIEPIITITAEPYAYISNDSENSIITTKETVSNIPEETIAIYSSLRFAADDLSIALNKSITGDGFNPDEFERTLEKIKDFLGLSGTTFDTSGFADTPDAYTKPQQLGIFLLNLINTKIDYQDRVDHIEVQHIQFSLTKNTPPLNFQTWKETPMIINEETTFEKASSINSFNLIAIKHLSASILLSIEKLKVAKTQAEMIVLRGLVLTIATELHVSTETYVNIANNELIAVAISLKTAADNYVQQMVLMNGTTSEMEPSATVKMKVENQVKPKFSVPPLSTTSKVVIGVVSALAIGGLGYAGYRYYQGRNASVNTDAGSPDLIGA